MRTTTRIATTITTTLVVVVAGGWAGALTAPAIAPTAAPRTAAGPAPADAAGTGTTRVATALLHGGLSVPAGLTQSEPVHRLADGAMSGWEAAFDLHGVPSATVLDVLRADLVTKGFELRSGTHDVFGVRQHDDRWEIVVARVDVHGTSDRGTEVLRIGIGSRPL
jgi:hypothetical protein